MASPGFEPDVRELHSRYDEQLRRKDTSIRNLRQEIESLRIQLGKADRETIHSDRQPTVCVRVKTRRKTSGAGLRASPVTTLRVGIPLVALLVLFCLVDLRRNNDVRDFRPVLAMTTTGTPPSQPAEATKKPAPPILKELEKLIESADYQLARRKILEMDDRDRLSPEVAAIALTAELMLDPERLRTEKFESPVAVRALGTVIQRSPDWKNRYSAVRSLEKISDPGKLPILVYALEQDPDWAVRSEAAMALRGETEEKIVLALENSAQFDPELLVRLSARQALARPAPGQPR